MGVLPYIIRVGPPPYPGRRRNTERARNKGEKKRSVVKGRNRRISIEIRCRLPTGDGMLRSSGHPVAPVRRISLTGISTPAHRRTVVSRLQPLAPPRARVHMRHITTSGASHRRLDLEAMSCVICTSASERRRPREGSYGTSDLWVAVLTAVGPRSGQRFVSLAGLRRRMGAPEDARIFGGMAWRAATTRRGDKMPFGASATFNRLLFWNLNSGYAALWLFIQT